MSSPTDFSEEAGRRNYKAPHSGKHHIPTIQKYRENKNELDQNEKQAADAQESDTDDESKTKRAFDSVKAIFNDNDERQAQGNPYPTVNRNTGSVDRQPGKHDSTLPSAPSVSDGLHNGQDGDSRNNGKQELTATEKAAGAMDPKQKRKEMKHNKRDDGGRVVTDPVTHLPLVIRDSTEKDIRRAPMNEPSPGEMPHTSTGLSGALKSTTDLNQEHEELQQDYDGMQRVFPPPAFDDTKAELVKSFQLAMAVGLGSIMTLAIVCLLLILVISSKSDYNTKGSWSLREQSTTGFVALVASIIVSSGLGIGLIFFIQGWLGKKIESVWADEVWDSARNDEAKLNDTEGRLPESVAWMNGILASVWPLINPDLFASIVDMLEDVMQASLPKVVRMVSVEDLGQGSEAIRILGVRWLPTGAAGQSVGEDGNLKKPDDKDTNDRVAPGQGEEEAREEKDADDEDPDAKKTDQQKKQQEQEKQAMREGMEAEQGDFVNVELAFSYRARSSGKSIKSKAKNAHLYLKFYLPGGIFVPVWVELRGIIGTMRLRLQLTPDPPFFSLCTLTFLGQPRADLSCVPLSKHLPNLMNVPLISSFVQSSIDAALAEYVAPKSLTLDLKDMLVGDDFKKDTVTRGVVVILIKEAKDFKDGDTGLGPLRKGSSDPYVTCSWSKFGKTITSTRIIEKEQNPKWHEWAYLLVTPDEINADEKLRLQLWDSDKHSADDDLGRVEVDLKELMYGEKTKNQMFDREDRFMGEDPEEKMPGTLTWSVGYYNKSRITDEQLSTQTEDTDIRTREDLKNHVSKMSENKLREATAHDESKEINQQKVQDYKERENALICASSPDSSYPSGILSIQIHNITGLEVESLQKRDKHSPADEDREDAAELSDDLPSSYCTIILNHKRVFMTRTKPKNAKPFFNAGTERFIRDWKTSEVMISIRDSKEGENDALLGIVYLPLGKVFEKRSQVMETYRLVGGIGFGRARISMVFRSVELKLPRELLGWEYGTLEIKCPVKMQGGGQSELQNHRIKFRSNMTRVKMVPDNGVWREKHGKESVFLPCRNRYAMPLVIEFRKSSMGPDSTAAFAVFWLHEIPDEEERTVSVRIWNGGKENLKCATTCAGYEGLDGEQPIGEIEVTMNFWRGLSGYHKRFGNKNGDMRKVMEVLDTANDEKQRDQDNDYYGDSSDTDSSSDPIDGENSQSTESKPKGLIGHTNDDSSASEDGGTKKSTKNPIKMVKRKANSIMGEHNDSDDGRRGLIGQALDYKDHHKQLHRKHRGIMQWKGARAAEWALDKARAGKNHAGGVFEHQEKGAGIEREV